MKTNDWRNLVTSRATYVLICVTMLTAMLDGEAAGQSRRLASSSSQVSRARQALMHTESSRTPRGFRPAHTRLISEDSPINEHQIRPLASEADYEADLVSCGEGEVIVDGEFVQGDFTRWDDGWDHSVVVDGCESTIGCNDGYSNCDCASCCGSTSPLLNTVGGFSLTDTSVFAGVHAFRGPANLGSTGSFGFHEGFNIGMPLSLFPDSGLGFQVGARFLQSNLSGADFTTSQRNQSFVTLGFFPTSRYGSAGRNLRRYHARPLVRRR